MSERSRLRGLLMDAEIHLDRATSVLEEASDYVECYPFLEERDTFLSRLLDVHKVEARALTEAVERRRKSI